MTALAGFRRVEAIPETFSVPAAGVTLRDTPFFDDSVVPVVGGGAVVLFTVSSRVRIGVEGVSTSDEGRICPISGPLYEVRAGPVIPRSPVLRHRHPRRPAA